MHMGYPLVFFLFSCMGLQQTHPEAYLWKNRLLIIIEPDVSAPEASRQMALFQKEAPENKERDLLLFFLSENKVWKDNQPVQSTASEWRNHFNIPEAFKGVILVGKDGTIKLKEATGVSLRQIYQLIDRMPMRQREMKQKN